MCTRFSFAISGEKLRRQFNLSVKDELQQSYNIGAGQYAYVLTHLAPELQIFRWGLVPYWAKEEQTGNLLIQAQAENINTSISFRLPIRRQRCLIFADSYYEWKGGQRSGSPFRVLYPDSSIMTFAGVWEQWERPEGGKPVRSFALITVPSNAEMRPLNERMPLLLRHADEWARWLDTETPLNRVLSMLQTPPDGLLQSYPVANRVADLTQNDPDLHTILA